MTETYELVISRHFDAPRELVYKAFTDPDQLAAWFGPAQFSVPRDTVSVDARVGGHMRLTMVNNDNPSWTSPVDSTFVEVIENQLLVGYELVKGFPGMEDGTKLTLSLAFIDEDGGTRLELRQGPFPEELRDMSHEGWMGSFTKLDTLLAS
ncbi:MAG: SRPBCC domain-containing protein [Propionibacteriales bacterium]|nr:SRPBCC domain-containing protein [Propionibacteriales bacterium]